MDYITAAAKVASSKTKENYMLVYLAYDRKLILPYKDGLAFIASMANAEALSEGYGKTEGIGEVPKAEVIQTSLFSASEYSRYKIAALMCISYDDVVAAEKAN